MVSPLLHYDPQAFTDLHCSVLPQVTVLLSRCLDYVFESCNIYRIGTPQGHSSRIKWWIGLSLADAITWLRCPDDIDASPKLPWIFSRSDFCHHPRRSQTIWIHLAYHPQFWSISPQERVMFCICYMCVYVWCETEVMVNHIEPIRAWKCTVPQTLILFSSAILEVYPISRSIWGFPQIGVPLNHPFEQDFPWIKPSILKIPHLWKPPFIDGWKKLKPSSPQFTARRDRLCMEFLRHTHGRTRISLPWPSVTRRKWSLSSLAKTSK